MNMLSNKTYEVHCRECKHEMTMYDCVDDCPNCGGFMKVVSKHGKCICGATIEFSHFTNTCHKCNIDYNSSGQQLAPRSQWGEETGESLSDILKIK